MRNIRHQDLVKIITLCSGVDFRGHDFNAMAYEFIPNGDLEGWFHTVQGNKHQQSRKLMLIERPNVALDVASALECLHQHRYMHIAHYNLKSSNVLLDNDMNALLGAFGLSRFLPEVTDCSQDRITSSRVKGSVGYLAPGDVSIC